MSVDGYATSAVVELSGLYGSAAQAKWVCSPAQMTGEEPYSVKWVEVGMNIWNWVLKGGDNSQQDPLEAGDPNADEVTFWIASYGIA